MSHDYANESHLFTYLTLPGTYCAHRMSFPSFFFSAVSVTSTVEYDFIDSGTLFSPVLHPSHLEQSGALKRQSVSMGDLYIPENLDSFKTLLLIHFVPLGSSSSCKTVEREAMKTKLFFLIFIHEISSV